MPPATSRELPSLTGRGTTVGAAVRRRLEKVSLRSSLVGELGVSHSLRRWSADRELRRRAPARRSAFDVAMWAEAAAAVGATFTEIAPRLYEFGRGPVVVHALGGRTPFANPVAIALASSKDLASGVLERAGVPIPVQCVVARDDHATALAFLESGSAPLVVKPARDGGAGQGVTTSIAQADQLVQALRRSGLTSPHLIVEREVQGEHYRLLLLDGEVLDVLERRRPRVVGDGRTTIKELMIAEYRRRLSDDRAGGWKPFAVDLDCLFTLQLQGLGPSSVPAQGEVVVVKGATNISGRNECSTFTAEVSPDVVAQARAAAAVLGVRLAGVDVVTPDVSRPLEAVGGAVLEVNPVPGLFHHYNVSNPADANRVAIPILEALLVEQAAKRTA